MPSNLNNYVSGSALSRSQPSLRDFYNWIMVIFAVCTLSVGLEMAVAKEIKQMKTTELSTATPRQWARAYAEATYQMDVPKIVELASANVTQFFSNSDPQRTVNNIKQTEELVGFYEKFKEAGNGPLSDLIRTIDWTSPVKEALLCL